MRPSFEMSAFVAIPTSTTVEGMCYKEVFERAVVRFLESHRNSESPGSSRNHLLFAVPVFFSQTKMCFLHFFASAPCFIWQRGKHESVPLVHKWCSSFSALALSCVLEFTLSDQQPFFSPTVFLVQPSQTANEQSQRKIMPLSRRIPGSLATNKDVPENPA